MTKLVAPRIPEGAEAAVQQRLAERKRQQTTVVVRLTKLQLVLRRLARFFL